MCPCGRRPATSLILENCGTHLLPQRPVPLGDFSVSGQPKPKRIDVWTLAGGRCKEELEEPVAVVVIYQNTEAVIPSWNDFSWK